LTKARKIAEGAKHDNSPKTVQGAIAKSGPRAIHRVSYLHRKGALDESFGTAA
jgi:hypothetical protein